MGFGRQSTRMGWKTVGLHVAEFAGGLCVLRVGLPVESIILTAAGLGLTLLGLAGITRRMSPPQQRPYA